MLINSVFYEYLKPPIRFGGSEAYTSSCYFPLKNTSVAMAMKGFFKENYRKNLIPKIYLINQHVVLNKLH